MKKKSWHIIFVLGLVGLIACLGFIAWNLYSDMRARDIYDDAASKVTVDDSSLTVDDIESMEFTGVRDGKESRLPPDIFSGRGNPIDFDKLTAINPDLYAWIRIQEADIDYPIAQHPTDDNFYLNHDLYKDVRFAGCIYTQSYNKKNFRDPMTVIYGHNMRDGGMFGTLHRYDDADFFKKARYCYIYTKDKIRVYDIFSTRTYSNINLMAELNLKDPRVRADYIKEMMETRNMQSNLREGVKVTTSDHLITLSTCIGGQPEHRFLVTGKLIWEGTEKEVEEEEAVLAAQKKNESSTASAS